MDNILQIAKVQYANAPEANLSDDVTFLNRLGLSNGTIVLADEDPKKVVKRQLQNADAANAIPDPVDDIHDSADVSAIPTEEDCIERLIAALKTEQLLGQVLKNFTGALEGQTKLNLGKECYGVGLRALGFWLNWVKNHEAAMLRELVDIIQSHDNAPTTKGETLNRAQGLIIGLTSAIGYGAIQRLSRDLGAPGLERTYDKMLMERPTVVVELTNLAIKLDNDGFFPEKQIEDLANKYDKNSLAFSMLQNMVAQHLSLFHVDIRLKQKVCAKLNINFGVIQGSERNKRLASKTQ